MIIMQRTLTRNELLKKRNVQMMENCHSTIVHPCKMGYANVHWHLMCIIRFSLNGTQS